MADLDRLAGEASAGLGQLLTRLGALAGVVALITAVIGLATFATGWWVFDGSTGWMVVGGLLCAAPFTAALVAWFWVRATAALAGRLVDDLRTFLAGDQAGAAGMLVDLDSGVALTMQARTLSGLRQSVEIRRRELPALYVAVRAVTRVPMLAFGAVLGVLGVGALGTILLIAGLID